VSRNQIGELVFERVQGIAGLVEERSRAQADNQIPGLAYDQAFEIVRSGVLRLVWSRTATHIWEQAREALVSEVAHMEVFYLLRSELSQLIDDQVREALR